MKKIIYSIITILLLLIIVFFGIKLIPNSSPTVKTIKTETREIVDTITTTGTLIPNKQSKLSQSGEVSEVLVKIGDKVTSGQTLASYSDGSHLVSEISGTVTQVNITKGDYDLNSQKGDYSIIVDDLSELKVKINLSKNEAKKVKINQDVKVTSGQTTVKGSVSEKNPTASESATGNSTLNALITLDKTPDDWFSGFDVDTIITTDIEENALTVPVNCVIYDDKNNATLFVVNDNIAKKIRVKTGIQSGGYIQIIDGVKKGDEVITNPDNHLKDNMNVKVGK